jgi:hypothetical protein
MKSWIWRGAMALPIVAILSLEPGGTTAPQPAPRAQEIAPPDEREGAGDIKLSDGKSQKDAILKAEYEQNLKDAALLVELSGQLKQDLEKNTRFVLSVATLKKTDEIEKLVKKIRSRMRRDF